MPKYVLECPRCGARYRLSRYVPGKRVICRKCRAVIEIPKIDGAGPSSAPASPSK